MSVPEGRIGPYEILKELGAGGMGSVYLARRTGDFELTAAIKVLQPGLDTSFFLERFSQERQILATLDHPNIARILDGGRTDDGRPYFVLEYIEGVPIDQYCEERKLTIADRLKIFRQVCAAVHYAHQHLVIHRDLKPTNVLVTADGTPKLLDFGIAKLLNEEASALRTRADMRLMTPEYASPEQVRGQRMSTVSDVYALGVMLYQLVTGKLPYELVEHNYLEYQRVICETAPKPPSAWRPLPADLEQIILMALRKEPERRYSSAEQFSEDLRRFLEGRTVAAQPDSFGYRTTRFLNRNKVAVAASAVVFATLLVGLGATLWQARIARQRFNDVRKLATSFIFEFHDSIETLPGSTKARQLVVKRGLEYLDKLAAEAQNDETLQREVADGYMKIGNVLGNPGSANLGDSAGAMRAYQRASGIFEKLAKRSNSARDWVDLADSLEKVADLDAAQGKTAEAVAKYRQALAMSKAQAGSSDLAVQSAIARGFSKLGDAQSGIGQTNEALESYTQALALYKVLAERRPDDLRLQQALAAAYDRIGSTEAALNQTDRALKTYADSLRIRRELIHRDSTNAVYRRALAVNHLIIGDVEYQAGKIVDSLGSYQAAIAIFEPLSEADPQNVRAQYDLAAAVDRRGDSERSLGQRYAALSSYEKGLGVARRNAERDPNNARFQQSLAVSYNKVGEMLKDLGQDARALENYQEALDIRLRLAQTDTANLELKHDLTLSYQNLCALESRQGKHESAIKNCQEANRLAQSVADTDKKNFSYQTTLSATFMGLGYAERRRNNLTASLEGFRKSLELDRVRAAADANNLQVQRELAEVIDQVARAHMMLKQYDEAEGLLRESLRLKEAGAKSAQQSPQFQATLADTLMQLGELLSKNNRGGEAMGISQRGLDIYRKLATASDASEEILTKTARALESVEPAALRRPLEAKTYSDRANKR